MMPAEFDDALWELYEGKATADAFFLRTRIHWRRLAHHILKRWRPPSWFGLEEVEQELMLGAWAFVWKFEDDRNVGNTPRQRLSRYVVYNAYDKAKKQLHKARNAKKRDDSAPSRVDVCASALSSDPEFDLFEKLAFVEADQEDLAVREQVLMRWGDDAEKAVLTALLQCEDFVDAAEKIYATPSLRDACKVTSPRDAARAVIGVGENLAARFGIAAA